MILSTGFFGPILADFVKIGLFSAWPKNGLFLSKTWSESFRGSWSVTLLNDALGQPTLRRTVGQPSMKLMCRELPVYIHIWLYGKLIGRESGIIQDWTISQINRIKHFVSTPYNVKTCSIKKKFILITASYRRFQSTDNDCLINIERHFEISYSMFFIDYQGLEFFHIQFCCITSQSYW